jgi:hypothetical protein
VSALIWLLACCGWRLSIDSLLWEFGGFEHRRISHLSATIFDESDVNVNSRDF